MPAFPNIAVPADTAIADRAEDYRRVDAACLAELSAAQITPFAQHESMRRGDVPTKYLGELCLWRFRRCWNYWVATGPGIPPDDAQRFHCLWGKEVRVDGNCRCPSPREQYQGFAVGSYHIDTSEGLAAFADLLRQIHDPSPKEDAATKEDRTLELYSKTPPTKPDYYFVRPIAGSGEVLDPVPMWLTSDREAYQLDLENGIPVAELVTYGYLFGPKIMFPGES